MTDRVTRLPRSADNDRLGQVRWILIAGASAAVTAAAIVLASLGGLMVLLWAGVPHDGTGMGEAVKVAGLAWVAAHGVEITVPGGEFTVVPLGVSLLPGYVVFRTAAWGSRLAEVRGLRPAALCAVGYAASYGVLTAIVSGASRSAGFQPRPVQALVAGSLVALVIGGFGILRGSGLLDDHVRRLPGGLRSALAAAGAGLLVMLAGAAALTAAALALQRDRVGELTSALASSWFEAAGLFTVCVAFAPNAILWSAALLTGDGFAIGAGTQVALDGAVLGPAPALPLLAALPPTGPFHPVVHGLLAVPAAAGVVAGLVVARARAAAPTEPAYRTAAWGGTAGVLGGAALGLLAELSGGSAGGGRLADVGAAGGEVAVAAGLEIAAVAALTAGLTAWWTRRRSPSTAGASTLVSSGQ